jgi:FKBP-type peptidyl-prolyl cis-trans isomerase FkpA
MKNSSLSLVVSAAILLSACGGPELPQSGEAPGEAAAVAACPQPDGDGNVQIQDGLVAKITKTGYGRAAVSKDYADVHTTLWLYDDSAEGGRGLEIWSSGGTEPFQFQLDSGQVIKGWDLGVKCMVEGEIRELRIAPELGYGERGKPPVPPNATLLFEIELVKLTAPG